MPGRPTRHMVGQGPAVQQVWDGWAAFFFILFISSILAFFSNASSLWSRDTEILKSKSVR